MLGLVLWKFWDTGVFDSDDFLAALGIELNKDNAFGIGLKLLHYSIGGVILLLVGVGILVSRRERIQVVEEVTTLLECPACKNQWGGAAWQRTAEIHGLSSGSNIVKTQVP